MSDDTPRFDLVPSDLSQRDFVHQIRSSFALVQQHDTAAAAWFYQHFLTANPRYRKYFSNDPVLIQRRLFQAFERIVADIDRLESFLPYVRRLALRHRKFGLRESHYQAFGASLFATMREFTGDQWTEQTEAAWEAGYGLVASVMLAATAEADQTTPPYWEAEVVGHELMAAEIARLTLRVRQDPARPGHYAFKAGQYAALETAGLVRTWRDFSFSGAPKAADEVEFQIQGGRTGGVSDALVNATAVGDRLRIAAAEGELSFPGPDRVGRLLAMAHGTGAAPIFALAQAATQTGDRRPLSVILVTEGEPHYLTASFEELAAEHGALSVEEVTGDPLAAVRAHAIAAGDDTVIGGMAKSSANPRAATGLGAVLVGPSSLIESCRTALLRAGVSPDDISSDLFG